MALSERQSAAAHRLGQDVCVVAGPGSGKTSVLIERFAWLVRERGIRPGRILAITFTEKAATEIKERLVREFSAEPAVREQIERAYVSTIHSFCARILRENAIAAAIDPEFTVLDRSLPLLREVTDEVLETLYATEQERTRRFLRALAVATEADGYVPDLATALINIYEAVRLAGGSFDQLRCPPPPIEADWVRLRAIAAEILADRVSPRTDKQREQHADALEWAGRAAALPDALDDEHFRVLERPNLNIRSLVAGSAAACHEPELRRLCRTLTRASLAHHYAAERALIPEALHRIDDLYRSRKRERSALDFDDLEEFAIGLLESQPVLRERIRSGFDFVLMDELQDTNPLQWRLMELVRRPDSFFAVGDVNQSIYGFRHASPELFSGYRRRLMDAGLEIDELRDNYRSRPGVLAIVNRVFESAAGIEPHSLIAGRRFSSTPERHADIIVSRADQAVDAERAEALHVAKRITELVGATPVALRDGTERPASFGDVAILTRANYSTAALQSALDEFGIPSVVLGGMTFYDTREVRDLKLLLDVLVNPRNEIALAGVLRSPLFGLSDEQLMAMTASRSLHEGVEANPPDGWSTVVELRRDRNLISPDRLLRRIIDERDYENGLSGRARANIDKFLAMIRDRYAADPLPLAKLVADIEDAAPEAEAPPPDFANAVRLMTLHKAKGLEFPIVCLPFLHKGRSYGFPIISWSRERGIGVKWRNPATNLGEGDTGWYDNRRDALDREEQEENRLLYVGMTRARDYLVLSWSRTGRERGAWPGLLAGRLGVDPDAITPAPVERDGLRIFVSDQPPEIREVRVQESSHEQELLIPRIEATDASEASASVTDISRFSECPRRYYLSRYLKWHAPLRKLPALDADPDVEVPGDMDELSASELGQQVHAILAGETLDQPSPEAVELADRFRVSPLGRRAEKARLKAREWDFVFDVDGLVLRGQIDLWFEYNREIIIVDYKTDRVIDPHSLKGYELQIQLYAEAIEKYLCRRPVAGILYFVRPNQQIDVDLTPLAIGAAREVVRQYRAAQADTSFDLRPGPYCPRCEFYRSLCPADLR